MRLALLLLLCGTALANGIFVESRPPTSEQPLPPVRLKDHRVAATIRDRVANVTVEQVFFNHSHAVLEGTYLFPLPRDAVVGEFAMTMGGRMIEGEVLEANRAREIYNSIVRRRRDPGLLEYVGRSLFRARVFPIAPRKELRVRLSYQQVLAESAGTIELRYPLASRRLNHSVVESVVIDVRFESSVDLKSVYSPSHPVAVDRDGERKARVTFERGNVSADRDFVVFFGRSPDAVGFSLLSSKPADRDGTFLAVLAPRLALDESDIVPKDVVYVVDKSGSMQGPKLAQAKNALRHGVQLLREGDRFNVVAFSSDWKASWNELRAATEGAKQAADSWIDGLQASGSTGLEAALSHALRMGEKERLFLVVLLTDGLPTVGIKDADEIVARVRDGNRAHARVFTFGVGYDLDVKLLDRIAATTGGERDYVAPHERIDAVTARFFRRVDRPLLTDVSVELGPGLVQVYPKRMPDLFAGGQVVLLGRYAEPGRRTIRVRGKHRGKAMVYEYRGRLADSHGTPYLERLWAHRKVAFLLDEIRLQGENDELREEVIALATQHAIVTPYTAGLVVEPGHRRPHGSGGSFRGPNSGIPPGLREPSDPQPIPPPPSDPNTPAAPTTPAGPATFSSKKLQAMKKNVVASAERSVQTVADKTFKRDARGRWVDTAWDGKGKPKKIEVFSEAYFALLEKDDQIARYLAVGERVVFVYAGTVYEIVVKV
ncbi:MAG: VIT domain-containing protein [Planctomycetota bacterium]|jgi:Ca-activated chloride channel family protein